MEIKESQKKSVEEIETSITKEAIEELGEIQESIEVNELVPDKFYTGGLSPILSNYIPEGLELTQEELVSVQQGMRRLSTGLRAAIPIRCYGEKCPFTTQCPFFKIEKAPFGKNCPVESMLMDVYTKRYLDEFEVHPEDMSEVASMTMLAATHIMEMRAFMILGKEAEEEGGNPDGFIKNVVGFNNNDEPIIQMQEHPAFGQIERAWRWRRNLLESMVGTRKEKYRRDAALKERASDSSSFDAADLKSKIDRLRVIDISEG